MCLLLFEYSFLFCFEIDFKLVKYYIIYIFFHYMFYEISALSYNLKIMKVICASKYNNILRIWNFLLQLLLFCHSQGNMVLWSWILFIWCECVCGGGGRLWVYLYVHHMYLHICPFCMHYFQLACYCTHHFLVDILPNQYMFSF